MELHIDTQKKETLQNLIAQSKKSVRVIMTISKLLLLCGIIEGALYAVLNCIIPSLSIVHIHGTVQKDYEWIIISTSFILAPSLIISVCLRFLAINLAGSNNYARVDESLIISNDAIRYSFRIKHQSLASERYVVTLQFSEITAINFDSKMESLEFKGNIVSEYFDDSNKEKPVDATSLSNFVIYDYFEPSLKQALESKGININ